MKKKIILFMSLLLSLNVFSQNNIKIRGEIINNHFEEVYLYDLSGENRIATSSISKKGKFKIDAKITETNFYRLLITEYDFVFLILKPNDDIEIKIDVKDLKNPVIKGSSQSQLAYTALNKLAAYDEEIKKTTEKIQNEKTAYVHNLVKENPTSLSILFFLEEIDKGKDYELYKETVIRLHKTHPQNKMVVELYEKVMKPRVELGTEIPEIALNDKDGKEVKLSSFRGKYVLISFWDSWSGPCRKEMPNLTKVYERYRKKGFEIYSISLDKTTDAWLKACNDDNITWISVHDADHEYKDIFNVENIPPTLLIDKKGKIIAKNIRGVQVDSKLSELLD